MAWELQNGKVVWRDPSGIRSGADAQIGKNLGSRGWKVNDQTKEIDDVNVGPGLAGMQTLWENPYTGEMQWIEHGKDAYYTNAADIVADRGGLAGLVGADRSTWSVPIDGGRAPNREFDKYEYNTLGQISKDSFEEYDAGRRGKDAEVRRIAKEGNNTALEHYNAMGKGEGRTYTSAEQYFNDYKDVADSAVYGRKQFTGPMSLDEAYRKYGRNSTGNITFTAATGDERNQERNAREDAEDGGFGGLLPAIALVGLGIATGGFGLFGAGATVGTGTAAAVGTGTAAVVAEATFGSIVSSALTAAVSTIPANLLINTAGQLITTGTVDLEKLIKGAALGVVTGTVGGITSSLVGTGLIGTVATGVTVGATAAAITGGDMVKSILSSAIASGISYGTHDWVQEQAKNVANITGAKLEDVTKAFNSGVSTAIRGTVLGKPAEVIAAESLAAAAFGYVSGTIKDTAKDLLDSFKERDDAALVKEDPLGKWADDKGGGLIDGTPTVVGTPTAVGTPTVVGPPTGSEVPNTEDTYTIPVREGEDTNYTINPTENPTAINAGLISEGYTPPVVPETPTAALPPVVQPVTKPNPIPVVVREPGERPVVQPPVVPTTPTVRPPVVPTGSFGAMGRNNPQFANIRPAWGQGLINKNRGIT